ncbi:MAG: hypothetical protein EOM87_08815, partial [Clostridia bacterium]|nr:hypothetical protein [Clostridia bacterium]
MKKEKIGVYTRVRFNETNKNKECMFTNEQITYIICITMRNKIIIALIIYERMLNLKNIKKLITVIALICIMTIFTILGFAFDADSYLYATGVYVPQWGGYYYKQGGTTPYYTNDDVLYLKLSCTLEYHSFQFFTNTAFRATYYSTNPYYRPSFNVYMENVTYEWQDSEYGGEVDTEDYIAYTDGVVSYSNQSFSIYREHNAKYLYLARAQTVAYDTIQPAYEDISDDHLFYRKLGRCIFCQR